MKEYIVTALDSEGFEITSSIEMTIRTAKERACYFVSEDYARLSGITDIHKAEICLHVSAECLWDIFRKV